MNLARTVAIGVAGGALITWLAWAAVPAPRPPAPRQPRPRAVDRSGAELAREIARLHERLSPDAEPTYARNVFAFRARPPAAPPTAVTAPEAAAPAVPRPTVLTLAGMAEDETADGIVRTAIIVGSGSLYLVNEGDAVTPRYRVERLSADGATLRDLETGVEVYLGLR